MHRLLMFFALLLVGCTPYTGQIRRLDRAYAAGQIDANTYYAERGRLAAIEQQWGANMAQSINASNAQFQENMRQQQAANAYNYRTQVLAQPQRVNVYHSGAVRYDIYGHPYGY